LAAFAGLAASGAAHAQYGFVNNIAGTFTDVHTTGTLLVTGDDASAPVSVTAAIANAAFPSGTLNVCTNGHAGYGTVDTQYVNGTVPSASFYNGGTAAAVYWDDLITQASGAGVYWQQTTEAGAPVLIIQWHAMDHYFTSASTVEFELKIFGGGLGPGGAAAQFIYSDVNFGDATLNSGLSATIGYQSTSAIGSQFSSNTASIPSVPFVLSLITNVPTGACCLSDGTCNINTQAQCQATGGAYRGDNSTCSIVTCPTGACCLPSGLCSTLSSTGCTAASGTYHGDGTTCGATVCPTGACCLPSGLCSTLAATGCSQAGGTYRGDGSSCATAGCPSGACCLPDGSCTVLGSAGCTTANGAYRGDGTVCINADCPSGACCLGNGTCVLLPQASCTGVFHGTGSTCAAANCPTGTQTGPDVYIGDLTDVSNYGAVGAITAYSVGTNACNRGDAPVNWSSGDNHHPVIAQNMFRLMNGRFEQLGQSWLKHGFASTNSTFCGSCIQPPGGSTQLGVHCSDAYGSGLNGSQSLLGPRSAVNPTTGSYPYPFTPPSNPNAIDQRLQVFTTDVTPASNPNALYFVDAHYVTYDDAQWNNGLNNASYKQISITSPTATPTFIGNNHTFLPGIQAWKDQDASVTLVTADYTENNITARFWVAAKATNNGNGTWHYEYAVYNHNANRAAGSFSVPLSTGVAVTNLGFHAPFSHSGEPFSNAAWSSGAGGGAVSFSTTPFASDPNANAIRWGTLYNFRFDAAIAPVTGSATLGLFAPGSPASLTVSGLPVPGASCYANCDGSTTPPILTVNDFVCFQAAFAANDPYANCDGSTTPPILTVNDFVCFQSAFASGCP
jgi:hypothetical protein